MLRSGLLHASDADNSRLIMAGQVSLSGPLWDIPRPIREGEDGHLRSEYAPGVSDLAKVAAVLRCIAEVGSSGGLAKRHTDILANEMLGTGRLREPTRRTEAFTGMHHTAGAGAAATLTARLADKRLVVWNVEVWLDTWDNEGPWSAVVKGEIEVDDSDGEPQTVFDVQRTVYDATAIVDAVREAADLVGAYDEPDLYTG